MNERIERIINHPMRVPILTGVVSFAAGVGAGYILCLKKTETYTVEEQLEFNFDLTGLNELSEERRQQLSDEVKAAITRPSENVLDTLADLEEANPAIREGIVSGSSIAEEFIASKLKESMEDPQEQETEVEIVTQSVFANDDEDWNYEEEVKNRTEDEPYILHKDEFWAEEKDYSQSTLTFYEGDRIMVDEENVPVYNHEQVTGPLKFGHGSGDPNVVYIRNDKRHAEYEVLRDTGLYSSEVLGLEIEDNARVNEELKHSTPRKFKMD